MTDLGTITFGITLLIIGTVFFLLTPLILRFLPKLGNSQKNDPDYSPIKVTLPKNQNAVLIVLPGGQIGYINQTARNWFGLLENETPNLERLTHNTRPTESFLRLCATTGQARFNVQNSLVEGTSYSIPFERQQAFLITLERPRLTGLDESQDSTTAQAINIFTEIGRSMSASLDLETSIFTILDSIRKLIPSDFSEITLWDPETEELTPYRFVPNVQGEQIVESPTQHYMRGQGYSGYIMEQKKYLIVNDTLSFSEAIPTVDRQQFPFRSFIGIPLVVGGDYIGTLELASQTPNSYNESDLEILELLAGTAATGLQNAITYSREQQRSLVLSGVADLTRALGAIEEPAQLYQQLIDTISSLLAVKTLGFILYDESQRLLIGQNPFLGLPDHFVALFQFPIEENSPGQKVLEEQDLIFFDDTASSQALENLGLQSLIIAAGIENGVMVPMISSGRMLGYLLVANKKDGALLDDTERRLLQIIAGQTAPILENVNLMQQSRLRALRSETLRKVASLAGSNASADEILYFSLAEISRFLQADYLSIFQLNQTLGTLSFHADSAVGIPAELGANIEKIAYNDLIFGSTVTSRKQPFISTNLASAEDIPDSYNILSEILDEVKSIMIVPLVVGERVIGEMIAGSKQSDAFDVQELQFLNTTAGQLANAIERSALLGLTDTSLQDQVDRLAALQRISRELNTINDPEHLINRVYQESLLLSNANIGSIQIFDLQPDDENNAGFKIGEHIDFSFALLQDSQSEMKKNLLIEDFELEDIPPPAPEIRSAAIVPIVFQDKTLGIISLYNKTTSHFEKEIIDSIQTLSAQAAIAINNTYLYNQQLSRTENLSQRNRTLTRLFENSKTINLQTPSVEILTKLSQGIQEAGLYNKVLAFLFDPDYQVFELVSCVGFESELNQLILGKTIPRSILQDWIRSEYAISAGYKIPEDQRVELPILLPETGPLKDFSDEYGFDFWKTGPQVFAPLYDKEDQLLGLLAIDHPFNPNSEFENLEGFELFASKAAVALESINTIKKLNSLVEQKGSKSNGGITSEDLSLLLHKDLEHTLAIQQLSSRAHNVHVGLAIAQAVNQQPDRESVLNTLARQLLTEMELDIALVAEPSEGGVRLQNQMGNIPQGANPEALLGQRNPLRHTIQTGEMIFVPNLDEAQDWESSPLLKNLEARGFICMPILSGGQVDAAVLAISNIPIPNSSEEDRGVYDLISSQVAITLQNLTLLTETRRRLREVNLLLDFSTQLDILDSTEVLNNLVENTRKTIGNAHGAMIALWDTTKSNLTIQAASGYSDNETLLRVNLPPEESLPGQIFSQGDPQRIEEINFSEHYNLSQENILLYRNATGGRFPVSSLMVPIRTGDIFLGGIIMDNFNTINAFNQEDQALISSLAQQTALTLVNARLFEEARIFTEELEQRVEDRTADLEREHNFSQTLLRISTELSSSLDLDMVLNRSLDFLNQSMGAEHSTIVIIRPGQNNMIYRAGHGIHPSPPTGGTVSQIRVGAGLAGWVTQNRDPVVIPDLMQDPRWMKDASHTSVYRSCIAVPLIVGAEALGSLLLYHTEPNKFAEDQTDAVQAVANQFAVTINNGELFRLIRDQAEDLGLMLRRQQIEAQRSTAMLEGVADGVLVTDASGSITLFNNAAETILGFEQSQIIEQSLDDFLSLFGSTAEAWISTIHEWTQNQDQYLQADNRLIYTEQIDLDDGRVISVNLAPVSDPQEFLGTISIIRDITKEVEVDRLKSEFVATVSHELRTPMTPIKGYVEFLLMGGTGELNDQQKQFLEIIKSNIDRLGILVDDLLDVSRIEAGKVALTFQPLDLHEITQEVVNQVLAKETEEERGISIQLDADKNLPSVYGDQERIRQILRNLIDNAYKYSPENTSINVSIQENDKMLQVNIKDQGIGIFPENQEKIFDRFYRGENHLVMASAGTGLGLSIVKELIEMHSGELWVESSGVSGEGSTFSFTLPISDSEKNE